MCTSNDYGPNLHSSTLKERIHAYENILEKGDETKKLEIANAILHEDCFQNKRSTNLLLACSKVFLQSSEWEKTQKICLQLMAMLDPQQAEEKRILEQNGLMMAAALMQLGKYKEAEKYASQSQKSQDQLIRAKAYTTSGKLYAYHLNDAEKAMAFYLQSLKITENLSDTDAKELQAIDYQLLGILQRGWGNLEKAKEYFFESQKIAQKYFFYKREVGNLNEIANIYSLSDDTDKALEYHFQALALSQKHDIKEIHYIYNDIACSYQRKKDSKNALKYSLKGLDVFGAQENARLHLALLVNSASAAIELQQYAQAEAFLKKAQKIAQKHEKKEELSFVYYTFAQLYEKTEQYKSAYKCIQAGNQLYQELFTEEKNRAIMEMQAKYETEKKEKEKEIYRLKNIELAKMNKDIQEKQSKLEKLNEELLQKNNLLEEANQKILSDLELARKLQHSLLPRKTPDFANVDFYAKFIPCESLSGDLYQIIQLDDQCAAIYIIDVCGHGASAAMITMFAYDIISSILEQNRYTEPKLILQKLNEKMLAANFANDRFKWYLTIFYGILNIEENSFVYSSAAHEHVYLLNADHEKFQKLAEDSFAVGWFDFAEYTQKKITLQQNDAILFLTDGIIEAFADRQRNLQFGDKAFEMFITESLQRIKSQRHFTWSHFLPALEEEVNNFMGKNIQFDDFTMLLAHLKEV